MARGNGKITDIAKEDNFVILTTGVKVKLNPAPVFAVERAASGIKLPPVPTQTLEDGRVVENPLHPNYVQAQREVAEKQNAAAIDAMIVFVDLVDGLPEGDEWLKKLKYLVKLGHFPKEDLEKFDLEDQDDREFVYKKFVAFGAPDIQMLTDANGIREEDLAVARESFRRTAQRDTD
jgi:hypothetical protein